MYETYYGLNERPFDLSPDPRFLFLSDGHREALTHLQYGLSGRPGLTVLIGEAGTGKTTVVRAALQSLNGASAKYVQLSNPTLSRAEFLEYLADGFGFSTAAGTSKTHFLRELEKSIAEHAQQGIVLALVIDEAQSVPHELLEEVRLLTNLEASSGKTLALALVGQPELAGRLNDPSLRQLKQRIALRCELKTLSLRETAAYIAGRVKVAGGDAAALFTRDAVCSIHEFSRGIPRIISVICDNALVNGFAADIKPVTRDIVTDVCRDFEIVVAAPVAAEPALVGAGRPAPEKAGSSSAAPPHADRASVTQGPTHDAPTGSLGESEREPQREPMFNGISRRRRFSFF